MKAHFDNFNLIEKPLLVNEAGFIFYYYINWLKAKNKDLFSFEDSHPGSSYSKDSNLVSLENTFDFNKDFVEFAKKVKKESLPYLQDFFKDRNNDILNLFSLFTENDANYLPFMTGVLQNINVYKIEDLRYENFKEVFDLYFLKFIGVELDEPNLKGIPSLKEWTEEALKVDLLGLIARLPYDSDLAMDLVRSFYDTKSIYDRLYPLIEKLCKILEDNFYIVENIFRTHFDEIKKDSYKKVNDVIDQIGIEEFLIKSGKGLDVYGLILMPNTIMIQYFAEDFANNFVKFGLFSDKKNINKNRLKLLSQYLKILGDPTRIDILDLFKEKNYYAKELSDKLYITPATLSYHISQLHVCGFIGAYIEGRKTYYYLRKPGFEKVIEELTEFSKDIREENHGKES